jgi:uncharacterized protein YndB with AHSA1/START domain
MVKIRVEYTLDKPIDEVFDALTDHANYTRFVGFSDSELLEAGHDEPNGEGALRLLVAGRMTFKERITRFERPRRMDYRIEELSPLPLRHDRGEITLTPVDDTTSVVWISEGRLTIPLIGSLLSKPISRRTEQAFLGILKQIEREQPPSSTEPYA